MPKRKKPAEPETPSTESNGGAAPARPFWSGTISFGLVSIPVELFAAVRARRKSLKMVDKEGHALGRQYHCSADGKKLSNDDLVRGYETESGEIVVITDEEFESLAPEMSRDIELKRFVAQDQIAPMYYDKSYFLAPAGQSSKAYILLAKTMERTGRVAIGKFVMRDHEYLVAILAEDGLLRAETLRHADEIRSAETIGLPPAAKAAAKTVSDLEKEIEHLSRKELDASELEDDAAQALQNLAERKLKKDQDVIEQAALEDEEEPGEQGAKIIDFMEVLRKRVAANAVARTGEDVKEKRRPATSAKASRLPSAKKRPSARKRSKT